MGTLVLLVVAMGLAARDAAANSGVAFGPVLKQSDVGLRGDLDSGLLVLAVEHYQFDDGGERTRAEVALRVPIALGKRWTLAPQLGLVPVDYQSFADRSRGIAFSGSGTLALTVKLVGPFALALEPLRVEARFAQVVISRKANVIPTVDKVTRWELGAWAALRVGW